MQDVERLDTVPENEGQQSTSPEWPSHKESSGRPPTAFSPGAFFVAYDHQVLNSILKKT
jgi:hypothetical protein